MLRARLQDGQGLLGFDTGDLVDRGHLGVGQIFGRFVTRLEEQLRHHLAHTGNRGQRLPRLPALLIRLRLAAGVDAPAGEAGGQSNVLTLASDGQGELLIGDDDLHAVGLLVQQDLGDLGGSQRTADIFGLLRDPVDDVDLLSPKLLHHRLNPGSLHAHTGTHRIYVGVVGDHGDLGPAARLPGRSLDLDDPFIDLGDLLFEQLDQHARVGARQDDLGASAGHLDADDVRPDSITLPIPFPRHLLLFRQDRIGPSQVHDDVVLFEALHDAVNQLALAILELVEDDLALDVPHPLYDVLLGRLSRDPAEHRGVDLHQQLIAQLHVRVQRFTGLVEIDLGFGVRDVVHHDLGLEQLDLPDIGVVLRLEAPLRAERLLGRRYHGGLDGLDQDLLVDTLFLGHLLDDSIKILLHHSLPTPLIGVTPTRTRRWP